MNSRILLALAIAAAPVAYFIPTANAQQQAVTPRYSARTKLGELMDNPKTLEILKRHIPEVMADPEIVKGRKYSLRFIAGFDKRIKAALPAIERDLAKVE